MGKGNTRTGMILGAALLLAAVFVHAPVPNPAGAEEAAKVITGPAKVIEGDLIEIGGQRLRLYGIDAPEMDQICKSRKGKEYQCGDHAMRHLAAMLKTIPLQCKNKGKDESEDGNLLAVCYLGFINVNENMVYDGWALAYREHGDDYIRAERVSRTRRQGMWKNHVFVAPWDWRKGKR